MAAIQFDTRFGELGGQRMLPRGVGDDRDEEFGGSCGSRGGGGVGLSTTALGNILYFFFSPLTKVITCRTY